MSRIALLGGGGFIGSNLACRLHESEFDVRVFSRTIHRRHPEIAYTRGMVEDQHAVAAWLSGCDELLYVAHNAAVSPYQDHDRFALMSNIDPFVQTLHTALAAGCRRILLMSSGGAIYGRVGDEVVDEQRSPAPISAYGLAKLTMENYLRLFADQHGLSYLILRASNVYGPGQTGRQNQGVIPIFLSHALLGTPVEIWGATSITKDYLYVDDFAAAAEKLIMAGYDNRCYNVGSGESTTLAEIIQHVEATAGRPLDLRYRAARPNDVHRVQLDCRRLHARIEWSPQVDLATGIRHTFDWLQSHPAAVGAAQTLHTP